MMEVPPPALEVSRLLEYAEIDPSIIFTGRQTIYVDGELLGPVPRLAICLNVGDPNLVLLLCGDMWETLGAVGGSTLEEIKACAEGWYRGVSEKWISSPYGEDEVNRYFEEKWGELRCAFCEKWPWETNQVFTGKSAAICDDCVRSFHGQLDDPVSNE